jgi:hypothetical protein
MPIFMVPAMGNVDLTPAIVIRAAGKHVQTMLLPASFHSLQGFSMPRQNHIFILPKKNCFRIR